MATTSTTKSVTSTKSKRELLKEVDDNKQLYSTHATWNEDNYRKRNYEYKKTTPYTSTAGRYAAEKTKTYQNLIKLGIIDEDNLYEQTGQRTPEQYADEQAAYNVGLYRNGHRVQDDYSGVGDNEASANAAVDYLRKRGYTDDQIDNNANYYYQHNYSNSEYNQALAQSRKMTPSQFDQKMLEFGPTKGKPVIDTGVELPDTPSNVIVPSNPAYTPNKQITGGTTPATSTVQQSSSVKPLGRNTGSNYAGDYLTSRYGRTEDAADASSRLYSSRPVLSEAANKYGNEGSTTTTSKGGAHTYGNRQYTAQGNNELTKAINLSSQIGGQTYLDLKNSHTDEYYQYDDLDELTKSDFKNVYNYAMGGALTGDTYAVQTSLERLKAKGYSVSDVLKYAVIAHEYEVGDDRQYYEDTYNSLDDSLKQDLETIYNYYHGGFLSLDTSGVRLAKQHLIDAGVSEDDINSLAVKAGRASNKADQEALDATMAGWDEYANDQYGLAGDIANEINYSTARILGAFPAAFGKIGDLIDNIWAGTDLGLDNNNRASFLYNISGEHRNRVVAQDNSIQIGNVTIPDSWVDNAYMLGASSLDSLGAAAVSAATGGALAEPLGIELSMGGISLGLSSALDKMADLTDQGATTGSTLITGGLYGFCEMAFESWSIGKLLDTPTTNSFKGVVTSLLKDAGVNGSEEFLTTLADNVCDIATNYARSDYKQSVDYYISQGMSESQAKWQAAKDIIIGAVKDGLGGAIQGLVMGTSEAALSSISSVPGNYISGYNIKKNSTMSKANIVKSLAQSGVDAENANKFADTIIDIVNDKTVSYDDLEALHSNPVANKLAQEVTYTKKNAYTDLINQGLNATKGTDANDYAQKLSNKNTYGDVSKYEIGKMANLVKEYNDTKINTSNVSTIADSVKEKLSAINQERKNAKAAKQAQTTEATQNTQTTETAQAAEIAEGQTIAEPLSKSEENAMAGLITSAIQKTNAKQELTSEEQNAIDSDIGKEVKEAVLQERAKEVTGVINAYKSNSEIENLTSRHKQYSGVSENASVTVIDSSGKKVTGTASKIGSVEGRTITLENGNSYAVDDVKFSDKTQKELLTGVINLATEYGLSTETANSIVQLYGGTPGLSVSQYMTSVKAAIFEGAYGTDMSGYIQGFTKPQINYLTNIGSQLKAIGADVRESGDAEKIKQREKIISAATKFDKSLKGKVQFMGKELTRETMDELDLDDDVKDAVELARSVAEVVDEANIEFVYSMVKDGKSYLSDGKGNLLKDSDGNLIPITWNGATHVDSDGKIQIDLNAQQGHQNIIAYTMGHELTHWIRVMSPASYNKLAQFVVKEYYKHGQLGSLNAIVEGYRKRNPGMTYDGALEEVVAQSMQTMFTDDKQTVLHKLTEFASKGAEERNAVQMIKDFLENVAHRLAQRYNGLSRDTLNTSGRLFVEMVDDINELRNLFADALIEANKAARNGIDVSTTDEGNLQVDTSDISTDQLASGSILAASDLVDEGKFQIKTDEEDDYKQVYTVTASGKKVRIYSQDGKVVKTSVKKLRNELTREFFMTSTELQQECEEKGLDLKEEVDKRIRNLDKVFKDTQDLVKEYMNNYEFRFIGLQDCENQELLIKRDGDGNIIEITDTAMVNNGEYQVNIDFTKICPRREALQRIVESLTKNAEINSDEFTEQRVNLTAENILAINRALQKEGVDTACLICFVESKRYNIKSLYQEKFIDIWNDEVRKECLKYGIKPEYFRLSTRDVGTTTKKGRSPLSTDEIAAIDSQVADWRREVGSNADVDENAENPDESKVEKLIRSYVRTAARNAASGKNTGYANELKLLTLADLLTADGRSMLHLEHPKIEQFLAQKLGTSAPKAVGMYTPYNGEIELLEGSNASTKTKDLKTYLESIGGVRSQSFSDFMGAHVYDVLQKAAAMSARGFPAHTYTKEIYRAILFGMCGEKINMSAVFEVRDDVSSWDAGLRKDENGNLVYAYTDYDAVKNGKASYVQSVPIQDAIDLQNSEGYSTDCGIIGVGHSWKHNMMMQADPEIRMIIGYHRSSLPVVIAELSHLGKSADYTSVQNTLEFQGLTKNNYKTPDGVPSYATPPQDLQFYDENGERRLNARGKPKKLGSARQGKYVDKRFASANDLKKAFNDKCNELNPLYDNLTADAKEKVETEAGLAVLNDLLTYANDNGLYLKTKKADKDHATGHEITYKVKRTDANGEIVVDKNGKAIKDVTDTFYLYDDLKKTQDPYLTAQHYIAHCIKNGMMPEFFEFTHTLTRRAVTDEKGNEVKDKDGNVKMHYGLDYDVNFYKNLYDFNVIDRRAIKGADGIFRYEDGRVAYAPQQAVNIFNPDGTVVFGGEAWQNAVRRCFKDANKRRGAAIEAEDKVIAEVKKSSAERAAQNKDSLPLVENIQIKQQASGDENVEYAPTFYSQMGKVVDTIKQDKISVNGLVKMLQGKGVKAEEIKWSGIEEWLADKGKSVTKEELQEFIQNSMLQIERQDITDGESNDHMRVYETDDEHFVIHIPGQPDMEFTYSPDKDWYVSDSTDQTFRDVNNARDYILDTYEADISSISDRNTRFRNYRTEGGTNYREILFRMPGSNYMNESMRNHWYSSLYGAPVDEDYKGGILAHARIQDMNDSTGSKMLFIDEIQSDWHNEGQKEGYGEAISPDEFNRKYNELYDETFYSPVGDSLLRKVINANETYNSEDPYGAAWDLLFENAHSQIGEIMGSGEEVAQDEIAYAGELYKKAEALKAKRNPVEDAPFKNGKYVDFVLKNLLRDAAENGYDKLAWTPSEMQSKRWNTDKYNFSEGYKIEYDQDMPKFLNKFGKKFGAKVGVSYINAPTGEALEKLNQTITFYTEIGESFKKMYGEDSLNYKSNLEDIKKVQNQIIGTPVWSIDITPEMKNSVLYEGQPLYQSKEQMDSEYMDAIDKYGEDSDEVAELVKQAAEKNGFMAKYLYHGTHEFGRTKFNLYDVLFLSDRERTARGFSGGAGARKVKTANGSQIDAYSSPIENIVAYLTSNTYLDELRPAVVEDFDKLIERFKPLTKAQIKHYGLNESYNESQKSKTDKIESYKERFLNGEKFYHQDFNLNGLDGLVNTGLATEEYIRNFAYSYVKKGLGEDNGAYKLFIRPSNTLTIDVGGNYYTDIPTPPELKPYTGLETISSDMAVRFGFEAGYDCIEYLNMREGGDYGNAGISNVYAIKNPTENVKSADPVTYDDSGNIIPLSERFNAENEDIRYQAKSSDSSENDVEDIPKMSYNDYRTLKLAFERGNAKFGSHIQLYNAKTGMLEIWEKGNEVIFKTSSKKINDDAGVLYERLYRENDSSFYGDAEIIESTKGQDIWDSKLSGNGRYDDADGRGLEEKWARDNSLRSGTNLPEDNSGKSITSDKRSIEDDGAFSNAKKQNKEDTADIDTDVIQSLTEANKQLTKELGKAKVTNEKIIERAEKLAEKRKEKNKQKIAEMRKLVKLQGTVNAYSRGSLDAIAAQLIKYSGAKGIDRAKLIDKLQNYYSWLTDYGLKSENMENALKQAQNRIASALITDVGATDEEKIRIEAASQDVAEKVIDLYWNAQPVTTVASKNAQKTAELKQKNTEKTAELKQKNKQEIDKLRQKNKVNLANERLASDMYYGRKISQLTEQKNAQINELTEQKRKGISNEKLAADMYYGRKLHEMRQKNEQRISDLKQHQREKEAKAREARDVKTVKGKIAKSLKELSQALIAPSVKNYVPAELRNTVASLLTAIDMTESEKFYAPGTDREGQVKISKAREARNAKWADLQSKYKKVKESSPQIYDDTVYKMMDEFFTSEDADGNRIGEKTVEEMSLEELDKLNNIIKAVQTTVKNAVKLNIGEKMYNAFEFAKKMISETKSVRGTKESLISKIIPEGLDVDSMFNRLGGYSPDSNWKKAAKLLNDGQLKQTRIIVEGTRAFDDLLKTREDVKNVGKFHKDMVDIGLTDENGNAVKVSRGMMLSIYMHLLNEDNLKHVMRGSFVVPDIKKYYNGNHDAWGTRVVRIQGISPQLAQLNAQIELAKENEDKALADELKDKREELIQNERDKFITGENSIRAKIEKQMTDYDRKWIEKAQWFFDVFSSGYLNEATNEMYGFDKATVQNYFPIHSDKNFLDANFETVAYNFTLENMGMMQDRTSASNPIMLEDITEVINNQLKSVASYAGLAPAIKTFNRIYNMKLPGFSGTIQSTVNSKFGDAGYKYIDKLLGDLQGANKAENNPLTKWLTKTRGHLAASVLTTNLRVTIIQAASYPTAGAELGFKPLAKALFAGGQNNWMLSKADKELIEKYSPLLSYRLMGNSKTELSNIAQTTKIGSEAWMLKHTKLLTNWIQSMDGATVGRLWYAAQYYVQDKYKDLEKGTEEYYKKVAEVFNDTVEKTQPNYTVMQRPQLLRHTDSAVKSIFMYMTQRMQNFNIVYNSAAQYIKQRTDLKHNANGVTKDIVKESRKALDRALISQIAAAITLAAMKIGSDIFMHNLKPYKDDDDDITADSILEKFLSYVTETEVSTVPLGSELYDFITSVVTGERYYGVDIQGFSAIDDIATDITNISIKDGVTFEDDIKPLLEDTLMYFGIPAQNGEKFYSAAKGWYDDISNGGSLGDDTTVFSSKTTAKKHYIEQYIRALNEGDADKANDYYKRAQDITITNKNGTETKFETTYAAAVKEMYTDGELTRDQALKLLKKYIKSDKATDRVNGWDESAIYNKYTAGTLSRGEAINKLTKLYNYSEALKIVKNWDNVEK